MSLPSSPLSLAQPNELLKYFLGISDNVKAICSCESIRKFESMFFCGVCSKLQCTDCANWRIFQRYCPACHACMQDSELLRASIHCKTCINCPVCGQKMNITLTDEQAISEGPRIYVCEYCRWTPPSPVDMETIKKRCLEPSFSDYMKLQIYHHMYIVLKRGSKEKKKLNNLGPILGPYLTPTRYDHIQQKGSANLPPFTSVAMTKEEFAMDQPLDFSVMFHKESTSLFDTLKELEEMLNQSLASEYLMKRPSDAPAKQHTGFLSLKHPLLDNALWIIDNPDPKQPYQNILKQSCQSSLPSPSQPSCITSRIKNVSLQPTRENQLHPTHHNMSIKFTYECNECPRTLMQPLLQPQSTAFFVSHLAKDLIPYISDCTLLNTLAPKDNSLVLTIVNATKETFTLNFDLISEDFSENIENVRFSTNQIIKKPNYREKILPQQPKTLKHSEEAAVDSSITVFFDYDSKNQDLSSSIIQLGLKITTENRTCDTSSTYIPKIQVHYIITI